MYRRSLSIKESGGVWKRCRSTPTLTLCIVLRFCVLSRIAWTSVGMYPCLATRQPSNWCSLFPCLFFGCFRVDAQDMWVYWVTEWAHTVSFSVPAAGPVQSSCLDHNTWASMSPDLKYMHDSTELKSVYSTELKWQKRGFMVPRLFNSVGLCLWQKVSIRQQTADRATGEHVAAKETNIFFSRVGRDQIKI